MNKDKPWDGKSDSRDNSMSEQMFGVLMEIKEEISIVRTDVAIVKTEIKNAIELIGHHRKDSKIHIENDNLNFKALGLLVTELEHKVDKNQVGVMAIILPACGGFTIIVLFLKFLKVL